MKWYRLENKAVWQREDGAQLTQLDFIQGKYILKYKGPTTDHILDAVYRFYNLDLPVKMLPVHYFGKDDYVLIVRDEIHPMGGPIDNITGRYGRVVDMDNKFLYLQLGDSELITSVVTAGRCDVCTPDGNVIELCPEELRNRVTTEITFKGKKF